jgi:ubiquinone/menaquinone biosynthesis C-methylase UbiE
MTLNIGCGLNNRKFGDIDFDINISSKPDICGNCEKLPFKNGSFEKVKAFHVLEHVDDIVTVMDECWRALKYNGSMEIVVPMFPHDSAMADPTHKRFFVPLTFSYFTTEGRLTGLKHVWEGQVLKNNGKEIVCVLKKV